MCVLGAEGVESAKAHSIPKDGGLRFMGAEEGEEMGF